MRTCFTYILRPRTAHDLSHLALNVSFDLGQVQLVYAVARSYMWQWNLAYLHLEIGEFPDYGVTAFCSCTFYSRPMPSAHRYTEMFCCLIALCDDGYTIIFIHICWTVHKASLQGSYLMVLCSCYS